MDELEKLSVSLAPENESVLEEFERRQLAGASGFVSQNRYQRGISHGPLPIVIGITGHRDLRDEDLPRLENLLRTELDGLQKEYPSTSLIVLSALADGADRLGARVAIELGLRLIVPLPVPKDLYEMDFDTELVEEFRNLLARAEHSFELPLISGFSREDILIHGPNRDQQYAQLGGYLATHSEILIALWDGVPRHLMGGTSQTVDFKLKGVPEPFAPPHSELDAPDSGPVYQIVTPRKKNPNPPHALTLHKLYPPGFRTHLEAGKANRDIYERIETFNYDALHFAEELKDKKRKSMEYIFPLKAQRSLPPMLRETLEFYSIADVLSMRFQKRTLITLRVLLSFVLLAAIFYDVYADLFENISLVALYLVMFTFAFGSYYWAARKGYQTKYLDYRALAEGLRVQFFWKLADVKDSVADYYMRKQKSELDWIRNAVRSTMTETCDGDQDTAEMVPLTDRLKQVLHHWVEDQAKYFGRAAHRDHECLHRNERRVTWLFASGLIFAALQLILAVKNHFIIIGVGLFPVLAALLHTYLQKNALAEHTKQYDRMSVLYHRAKLHLDRLIQENKVREAQSFIAELGREALCENGDWILTHRDRPLEVPKGA
jgi:hypothetical protein